MENLIRDGVTYRQTSKGEVIMYTIGGITDTDEQRVDTFNKLYAPFLNENFSVTVGNYHIPVWGTHHNLYPQEVAALINENKLLPSIIRKQEDLLYGHGPYLYKEDIIDNKYKRVPVIIPKIWQWLRRWEDYGVASVEDYLRNLISDYYRVHTCVTQYHFARSRKYDARILALSYIGVDEARLATEQNTLNRRIKQTDCKYVAVGDWFRMSQNDFDIYHRFDPTNPYRYANAVAFNAQKSFGKWVYAYNDWFDGLREWVKASNLTPRYLNSYLKNALNAHVHVRIPQAWIGVQENTLKALCSQNIASATDKWVKEYKGVKLVDMDKQMPYAYNVNMLDDLIAGELEKVTKLLSGEGKNQGKLYATTKVGNEGWDFSEFPSKFKEYFDSVIAYDKRADQVTLAGIGINSSITNVENDGVISKSGSDVYYNYVVYMNALTYAEQFVCKEINRAIALNFPNAAADGVKIGFNTEIPLKLQETSPKDRM